MANIFGMPRVFGQVLGQSGNTPTPAQVYAAYVTSLGALLLYDGTLTADGTKIKNLGSGGDTYDGTPTDVTIDANGMNFNGTTSKIVIPDGAAIQALATYSIIPIAHFVGYGENNAATLLHLGTDASMRFGASGNTGSMRMGFDAATTNADSITAVGFMTLDQTALWVGTFDNAGDRTARIYRGLSGTVTEPTYGAQTAADGARVAPVGAIIGNFSDVRTHNGFIKSLAVVARVITAGEMANLASLAKAIGA